jgi:hypothetical protein
MPYWRYGRLSELGQQNRLPQKTNPFFWQTDRACPDIFLPNGNKTALIMLLYLIKWLDFLEDRSKIESLLNINTSWRQGPGRKKGY